MVEAADQAAIIAARASMQSTTNPFAPTEQPI